MEKCIACGKTVFLPEKLGIVTFCTSCSLKIQMPFWKNRLFSSSIELESQREKVVQSCEKNNFSASAIAAINSFFADQHRTGLLASINGGQGQTLKVYQDHCIVDTKPKFDVDSMAKEYAKISRALCPTDSADSFFGHAETKNAIVSGLLRGNFLKTTMKLATAAAVDAIIQEEFEKKHFPVVFGEKVIYYKDYTNVELLDPGVSCTGILRFRSLSLQSNNRNDVFFFFGGSSPYEYEKAQKKIRPIHKTLIDLLYNKNKDTDSNINQDQSPKNNNTANEIDPYEEVRKLKALLDEGILTQEEFDKKKTELFGL